MIITSDYQSPEIQVLQLVSEGAVMSASENIHDLKREDLYYEEF